MANISNSTTDENGNVLYNISADETDTITLETANTYVDKNIVLNISVQTDGLDTSDADAIESDIKEGKTAYVNGVKITGTHVEETFDVQEKEVSPSEIEQTITADAGFDGLSSVVVKPISSTYIGSAIAKDQNITVDKNVVTIPAGYYSTINTETIATVENATPSISVGADGLITATVTQGEGYVSSGVKTTTEQLAVKDAETFTPSNTTQVISGGQYLTGNQTILGDADLVPNNIASGVDIFGVVGTYTNDADATEADIKEGKTAYINGVKVTGTHVEDTFTTEEKTVTPNETTQVVTPDAADGLSKVTVNAISNTYVGSSIARDPEATVNGASVTIPTGYYTTQTVKTIDSGALGTVSASKGAVSNNSITVTPSISGGTAGYIAETSKTGNSVTVSASELVSGNMELTPTESAQSDVDVTNYQTVSVAAISNTYIGSSVTRKEAQQYIPSTADQTIDAGQYLNGAQTIKGDANLTAENIADGITIFGVTGTHQGGSGESQNYYTGEANPDNSLGQDGDIYFKTGGAVAPTPTGNEVGTLNSNNTISLTDSSLPSDTYTLYYEDASGNKLDKWAKIGTITN